MKIFLRIPGSYKMPLIILFFNVLVIFLLSYTRNQITGESLLKPVISGAYLTSLVAVLITALVQTGFDGLINKQTIFNLLVAPLTLILFSVVSLMIMYIKKSNQALITNSIVIVSLTILTSYSLIYLLSLSRVVEQNVVEVRNKDKKDLSNKINDAMGIEQ